MYKNPGINPDFFAKVCLPLFKYKENGQNQT